MSLLLAMTFTGFSGFSLLLPLSPLWAVEGGADEFGAGLVTTVLMGFTVVAQLNVNRLLSAAGWPRTIALGLALLGLPSLVQAVSADLWGILLTTAVRGIGFGIITVCASTGISILAPPESRGRAIGLYGLAVAVPQVGLMTAGPAIVDLIGLQATILLGVVPVIAIAWTAPLGRAIERFERASRSEVDPLNSERQSTLSPAAHLRRVALPVIALVIVTATGGSFLTFAPQVAPSSTWAMGVLFGVTLLAAFSRWIVGPLADRFGTRPFVWSLMAIAGAGVGIVALSFQPFLGTAAPGWLIAGACVLGISYGGMQTVTLVRAFSDGGEENRSRSSVAWNVGFDVGTGLGAMAVGAIAISLSFGAAFTSLAVLCAVAAVVIGVAELRRR